ncbi:MAG: carboxyl transferase domain-containing protein, partial [Betaproteobacteria bacterium]
MLPTECLATLKSRVEFTPSGDAVGNLTIGRGSMASDNGAPSPVLVGIIENRIASGSLGVKECEKLASLFKVAEAQKRGLILYVDSAGARVSDGLPALGAFRHMYRAAVSAVSAGAPMMAVCGANCFGGASMLAALAGTRVYSANTRLAMSGPSILAQAAGVSALDEAFAAMSVAAISGQARSKLGACELMAADPASMGASHFIGNDVIERHALLGTRLSKLPSTGKATVGEKIERKDFAKLYPQGY